MTSVSFPKMFNTSVTLIKSDLDATKQNSLLLFKSEKGELKFDPYFGIRLKRFTFDQNNYILKDILIDEIYTQCGDFLPQLTVNRNDIEIIQVGKELHAKFKAINNIDFVTSTYDLVLLREEDR